MPTDSDMIEVGSSGLSRLGGFVNEEFHPKLRGTQAAKVFLEMRSNDPIVGAILFGLEMVIRQVAWRIEPASSSTKDVENAKFVDSCLNDMSFTWSDTISEILSMLPYGWAYHEIVYKRRSGLDAPNSESRSKYSDGKVGWRKMPLRSQESLLRWEFDESGGISGMWQQAPPSYSPTFLPIQKCLLFRTSVYKNNPEGRSALRNAYRPWYFKKRIEEIEAIGIERDLAGLPIMYVDPRILSSTASAAEKALLADYKEVVVNIRRDEQEGLVLPLQYDNEGRKLFEFSLMSSGGTRQFDTSGIISRKNQEIAMTVLADFILLGHERIGSFALSADKTDLFALAVGSWLDMIAATFNAHAIPRLLAINNMADGEMPSLMHGDIESPDLGSLGNFVQVLSTAGVPLFPDDDLENYLREAASLPKKSMDKGLLEEQRVAQENKKGGQQVAAPPKEGTPAKPDMGSSPAAGV